MRSSGGADGCGGIDDLERTSVVGGGTISDLKSVLLVWNICRWGVEEETGWSRKIA